MSLRTKATTLMRKAVSIVSAPFRLNDVAGYRAAMGQAGSATRPVNTGTALQLSVVFACARLIAETIATLPFMVYRRKNGGGREVDVNHPLYELLHDSPNAEHTAVEFWEAVVLQLILRECAYVRKGIDVNGNIFELVPMDPDRMGTPYWRANGAKIYPYNHPTRGRVEYTADEVWQINSFGGMSVIQLGARSMGAAANAEHAASKLYGDNMRPTFVATLKEWLSPSQRKQAKEAIADSIGGSAETGGRFRLIEGGVEFKQLSLTPEDAQLLETRVFSVEDLCRWFGVPPAMVQHGTAVSNWGTGREQQNLGFLQYVLRPYLKRLEQGVYKALLKPEERRRITVEFSVEGLLRADSAGRAAYYASMVQNGIYTRNFCRSLENLDPVEGGDDLTVQSNLIPVSLLGQGTTAPEAVEAVDALKRALGIEEKTT